MRRVVVVLGSLAALAGCGDLSQEDLLFRAAVPPREAVAVTPPGSGDGDDDDTDSSETQGLEVVCADGDLRCEAQKIATGFNALTFGLLTAVDNVAALPPTHRAPGRRIWGPHYDAQKDETFRFEMVREDDEKTFSFCLFATQGRVGLGRGGPELDCDDDDDGRLIQIFSGSFVPDGLNDNAARRGAGTMRFHAERASRLDGSDRFARVLDFAFDNTNDRSKIRVDVVGTTVGDEERDAGYDFSRETDGSGTFLFDVFADLVSEGLIPERRLEHIQLAARWDADQAGRATGVVDDGDIAEGTQFRIDQCWGPAPTFETTFFDGVGDDVAPTGDPLRCVFEASEVTPAG